MEIQLSDIQNAPAEEACSLWDQLCSFQMPSSSQFVEALESMSALPAVLLFACGLAYMLQGWKVFKVLILVNSAILGALLGHQLGSMLGGDNMPLFGGLAGALLLAVLSWPCLAWAPCRRRTYKDTLAAEPSSLLAWVCY